MPTPGRIIFVCIVLAASGLRAATPQEVDKAILNGRKYLLSQLKNDHFEIVDAKEPKTDGNDIKGGQFGGLTALACYALLASGEDPQGPEMQKVIQFLLKTEMLGTYAVGLRCQAWNLLPKTPQIKQAILKDANYLKRAVRDARHPARGLYNYLADGDVRRIDHSVSQYGVLGMWACSETIEGIPDAYWTLVDQAWRANQDPSGGWFYGKGPDKTHPAPTLSMTAAGVATLFITQDFRYRGRGVECAGNIQDKNIATGMNWLAAHFDEVFKEETYYTLYGLERVGVASGFKYFGTTNWYESGADFLVKKQYGEGKWGYQPWYSIRDTSFALLFLSRGRAPVMVNKLDYDLTAAKSGEKSKANWNQRARDIATLTHWVGKQTERALNWQIVNLQAPLDELYDAPILYIAGNQKLSFSADEEAKLKKFIEGGGLVFGNADCAKADFAQSFQKLGNRLFPELEFRPLDSKTHPILVDQQFPASKWKKKPQLLGLSNGARELMLLLPDSDAARFWQLSDSAGKPELFQLAANIFLYAVDKKELRYKGETYLVGLDPRIGATRTIDVARIKYGPGWDPEPGGWRRLGAILNNLEKIALNIVAVDPAKDSFGAARVAHLTGTGRLKLSEGARAGLKKFCESGGTMIVDACGGSAEFAQSAEAELLAMFPDSAKSMAQTIPSEHPVFSRAGKKLNSFEYRTFARAHLVGDSKLPRLRGIELDGRMVVVFSREDLSVGIVGQSVDGIIGYDPVTATDLMRNLVVTAGLAKIPSTTPAK